mmetsp:Transcript_8610/g.13206  ORF Transcript_8610/g.13206 Transcript_8610/m.13206 type:complete len:80 (-) Transcript_8610:413-652(-)
MVFKGQDAWRKHPMISNCWKNPLPGLGAAVAIFSVYLALDFGFKKLTGPVHVHGDVKLQIPEASLMGLHKRGPQEGGEE